LSTRSILSVLVSFGLGFVDGPQHRRLRRVQAEHRATALNDLRDQRATTHVAFESALAEDHSIAAPRI
jgi:hypothetical protein